MKTQQSQLELELFPIEKKVRRVATERPRDSLGKFATDLAAANDQIQRLIDERDKYKINYLIVAKELATLQHKQHDTSH